MFSTELIRASILFARKGKYGAFLLEETVQSSRNSTTLTSRSLSRANQTLKRLWNFVIDSEKLDVRDWDTIRLIIHPSDRKANVYSHHRLVYNSIEHRRLFRGKEIKDIYPSHTTSIQHSILHWVVVLNTLILRTRQHDSCKIAVYLVLQSYAWVSRTKGKEGMSLSPIGNHLVQYAVVFESNIIPARMRLGVHGSSSH